MAPAIFIHNARVWTGGMDAMPSRPPSTVLVENGRIVALDLDAAPGYAQSIDAAGRTIAPGFIDAHMHLITGGLGLRDLDLRTVQSPVEFQQLITERHEQLAPGEWLIARNWSAENWGGEPQPDKSWLEAAGDRPAVCYRMDLHAALVNDAVLKQINVHVDSPGGRIARDGRGEPTGMMIEAALWKLVNPLVPEPDRDAKRQAVLEAQRHCHAMGITTVGTMEYMLEVREVLLPLADRLTMRCAATLLDRGWPMNFAEARELANACRGNVSVIGCKAFADGTFGLRTARMLEDYADDPGNRGMLVEIAAQGNLRNWVCAVADAGFSPAIHAIGDEAVRLALDSYEGLPHEATPRIEHAQQIHESDIKRFSARVIASMQPLHKADDGRYAISRLGGKRMSGFFPFRQLLDAGATLAFGSDWPVVSCDPIAGMRAAITGLTLDGGVVRPEENLTVEEALLAYTAGAARVLQLDRNGTIATGNAANLVMFDIDPFTADWVNRPPRVVLTIAGGRIVHHAHLVPALAGVERL